MRDLGANFRSHSDTRFRTQDSPYSLISYKEPYGFPGWKPVPQYAIDWSRLVRKDTRQAALASSLETPERNVA